MNYLKWVTAFLMVAVAGQAQSRTESLNNAFDAFEKDTQLQSATIGFYVIDAATGKAVFDKNGRVGVAPASTQKVITAITGYEVLGKDFRYHTLLGYEGIIKRGRLEGTLYVKGAGDPSFGSWRYAETKEQTILQRLATAVREAGIAYYDSLQIRSNGWTDEGIPGGWIWDDIANYYGAPAASLNWRENQYDLIMRSGNAEGSPATIVGTHPSLYNFPVDCQVTAAPKGTGDNTIIYFKPDQEGAVIKGTIPVNETHFTVSGAFPSVPDQFTFQLKQALSQQHITQDTTRAAAHTSTAFGQKILLDMASPVYDSLVYWFLKKSINLYGEALLKTIALQQKSEAGTGKGIDFIHQFWKTKGIDETELHMFDGSGLSPLNRITAHAEVTALKYAQQQTWFSGFYNALPLYNNMKMKSGSISGVRSFCGYQQSKDGHTYIFSLIVNNFNGSPSSLITKMYKLLDELK